MSREIPTLCKPTLQNTSFPHESKITSSSCAPTADIEVTQSWNATNESPKSTLQSRLEKPKPPRVGAAAVDVAEAEIEAEGVKAETAETQRILPLPTKARPLHTTQSLADLHSASRQLPMAESGESGEFGLKTMVQRTICIMINPSS